MAEEPATILFMISRTREADPPSLRVSRGRSGVSCKALHALGSDICRIKETKVRKPVPTWLLLGVLLATERFLRDIDVAVFIEGGDDLEFLVEAIKTCCLRDGVHALCAFLCAEMTLYF